MESKVCIQPGLRSGYKLKASFVVCMEDKTASARDGEWTRHLKQGIGKGQDSFSEGWGMDKTFQTRHREGTRQLQRGMGNGQDISNKA